jgi:hypothetical protein
MVVNVASRRVMEKAGLSFVRVFHQAWPYSIEGEEEGRRRVRAAQVGVGGGAGLTRLTP